MKYTWVLIRSGKWHAWMQSQHRSLCGVLHRSDLRRHPAKALTTVLPEGVVVCENCALRLRSLLGPVATPDATGKRLGGKAGAWLGLLRKHLTKVHARAAEKDLKALAERLATIGGPQDPEAIQIFEQVKALLLTPRFVRRNDGRTMTKITRLREAVAALPPDPEALRHVATAVESWRRVTGHQMSRSERFRPDTVVETMLKVPAPEAYAQHLHRLGLSPLALMYHPNVLESHQKDAALRGVFGGGGEYFEQTAEQLDAQIVKD